MLMVHGIGHIVQSGAWRQSIEIVDDDGNVCGFVERERTPEGRLTRTRNLHGEVMDGACLEWLMRKVA